MSREARFTRIIKENEGVIYKITTVYTNDKEAQKDLYQEIVYQLWKAFDGFKQTSKVSTWLYRVALNTALTNLNRTKRNRQTVAIDDLVMPQLEYTDTLFEERIQLLYGFIRQLPELEKGLILLFLEGLNYAEIAEITGLSSTNVGTKLSRIKQKLKTQMVKK